MLKVGDKLPEFEGTNQDGETVSSSQLIGKSWSFSSIRKRIHQPVPWKPAT